MRIKSLENRKKKEDNKSLYELYTTVIVDDIEYGIFEFLCVDRHSMRLDLISQDIYENTDAQDILCAVNGIINPLTVQSGDNILFIDPDDIDGVRSIDHLLVDILDKIKDSNNGKERKIDKNRISDLRKRKEKEKKKKLLPSNLLDNGNKNLRTENGKIKRGPNF